VEKTRGGVREKEEWNFRRGVGWKRRER